MHSANRFENQDGPDRTKKLVLKCDCAFVKHLTKHNMKLTKSAVTLFACVGLVTLFSGCASFMCGPHQSVSIDSHPRGAEVLVYDCHGEIVLKETTPCVACLDRREHGYTRAAHYVVLVRKEGYAPVQVPLDGSVNRAYCVNILSAGIGYFVDPMTGSMWTLSPGDIDAKLVSENAAFFPKGGIMICLKEEVPAALTPYLKPLTN